MLNFMDYLEYLAANGLTLDEYGNEVPINQEEEEEDEEVMTLELGKNDE